MSEVTRLLSAMDGGDPLAAAQLLPLIYRELRNLAAAKLSGESPGQTLQATALVHEAFVRLVDVEQAQRWNSRGHFFAAAAEAMRRILVENARRKRQWKQGGHLERNALEDFPVVVDHCQDDLLDLDAALTKMAIADPMSAQLIQLRYFVGLTIPDAARILGISPRSADRLWAYARAWLHREISGSGDSGEKPSEFLA
jgi:RNA polymerase sigma factor (TIGR02999 family)